MTGLIIEGVCATGKTIILNDLTQRQSYTEKKNKLQLSEHMTERVIENINPSTERRIELLTDYTNMFTKMHTTFYNSRFKNTEASDINPFYLVERFHLTHAVEIKDFESFRDIDNQLADIGFRVVILTMDKNVFKRRLENTFTLRDELWYNYIMSFGGIEKAAERYYAMQKLLLKYAKSTSLPTSIIDTTEMQWEIYADDIEKFWKI